MRFKPRRNSLRAGWWDYRSCGYYLLTLLTAHRRRVLGGIRHGRFYPTPLGTVIRAELDAIPLWCASARVDALALMPNHIHLILELHERFDAIPIDWDRRATIATIVGQVKSVSTRVAVECGVWPRGERLWHRSYHDSILPHDSAVAAARRYLVLNPPRWEARHGSTPLPQRSLRLASSPEQ